MKANIVHTEIIKHVSHSGQVLRWAILTTVNGYACVGNPSVAVSAENDRVEIGENVALENSKNALWPLMGYELKQRLHDIKNAKPPAQDDGSGLLPHQQRVVAERAELDARIDKLHSFVSTDTFAALDAEEQERLHAQKAAMLDYSGALADRIAAFTA